MARIEYHTDIEIEHPKLGSGVTVINISTHNKDLLDELIRVIRTAEYAATDED